MLLVRVCEFVRKVCCGTEGREMDESETYVCLEEWSSMQSAKEEGINESGGDQGEGEKV